MINIISCSHKQAEINIIICAKIDCNWEYQTCPLVDDPSNIPGRLYLIEIRKEKGGSWQRAEFGEGNSVMPSWECSLFKKSQGLHVEIFFFLQTVYTGSFRHPRYFLSDPSGKVSSHNASSSASCQLSL